MKTIFASLVLLGALRLTDAADWPQWRGPARDGHASGQLTSLPKELRPVWKISTGPGHSSPIIANGKLIYLDEQDKNETVHLLDAATGKEIWRIAFAEAVGDEWGIGPRSTPFVDGDRLYVQSSNGEFRCLDLADGKTLWGTSFAKNYGVKFVGSKGGEGTAARRGNSGCGVVEGARVYVPVGSTNAASIVCFDKVTGKEIWKSLNDEAAYSSFLVGSLAGTKQLVALTAEALAGLDLNTGQMLWRVPFKTAAKRHAASPVLIGDVVTANSQSIGLVGTRISRDGTGFKAVQDWANKPLKINLTTPVLVGRHLYSQGVNKDYVCVDATTGELQWSQPGLGRGNKDYASTIAIGKNLLVLFESGELVLLVADPAKYTELGRLQVCGSTWSHPAFADGKLYVRDGRELLCLDLNAK